MLGEWFQHQTDDERRVQDMVVINAPQPVSQNDLRGEDTEACVETAGPSGIDTVCCAEVGIRRRDCCSRTSDTVVGADPVQSDTLYQHPRPGPLATKPDCPYKSRTPSP